MNKQLIAALVMSSLTFSNMGYASGTEKQREHHEELIGVGSGIVLGAIVGGPIGAIIGAFTGGIIGKSVGDDTEIESQQVKLSQQETTITQLNADNQSLALITVQYESVQDELAKLNLARQQKLTELELGLNIQFKTGSSLLEAHFQPQLDELASALGMSADLRLDLTGYADRRGESTYNQALSEQRVAEVRSYLVSKGVNEQRLTASAYGASAPITAKQSLENDFFDRRVTIKFVSQNTAIAANH
ncbi:sortase-associated OmpA-like protein PdsO [Shewanella sp.]|uniref:sortase-associated OmpA-like protein PdsO n=1 Tax=Shewanella sp. TaxID=50422 RepID=UPI001ED678AE|nr:sortase-associated OmpA-like protein PdsO [Shewanella sp.]NRB22471.1 sortase-associated OmpA-like protein PdsO [Shewanella sp.]